MTLGKKMGQIMTNYSNDPRVKKIEEFASAYTPFSTRKEIHQLVMDKFYPGIDDRALIAEIVRRVCDKAGVP